MTESSDIHEPTDSVSPERIGAGVILLFIAISAFLSGVYFLQVSYFYLTIALGILAMICGNIGFGYFKKPSPVQPAPGEPIYELTLFSTALKSGHIVTVLMEVRYIDIDKCPNALSELSCQLQRSLNRHVSSIDLLSDDPYSEFDSLIQDAVEPLRSELGLENVWLQTIDVNTTGSPRSTSQGIHFGDL